MTQKTVWKKKWVFSRYWNGQEIPIVEHLQPELPSIQFYSMDGANDSSSNKELPIILTDKGLKPNMEKLHLLYNWDLKPSWSKNSLTYQIEKGLQDYICKLTEANEISYLCLKEGFNQLVQRHQHFPGYRVELAEYEVFMFHQLSLAHGKGILFHKQFFISLPARTFRLV